MRGVRLLCVSAFFALAVFLPNCGSQRYIAGREYLLSNHQEPQGYGLYSYILFSKAPNQYSKDVYLAVIESYLMSIPRVEELQRYVSRDSLNLVSLPLKMKPNSDFQSLDTRQKAQWLLNNYDYARAIVFLSKFEETLVDGPYIVSHTKPLSIIQSVKGEYIVQNLSNVNSRVVSLWVDAFMKQSAKAEFWDGEHLNSFVHGLRNFIAISADGLGVVAESLSWWKAKLGEWIVQK